jgi:hypothetical protein
MVLMAINQSSNQSINQSIGESEIDLPLSPLATNYKVVGKSDLRKKRDLLIRRDRERPWQPSVPFFQASVIILDALMCDCVRPME